MACRSSPPPAAPSPRPCRPAPDSWCRRAMPRRSRGALARIIDDRALRATLAAGAASAGAALPDWDEAVRCWIACAERLACVRDFSADWLALRETADAAARDRGLGGAASPRRCRPSPHRRSRRRHRGQRRARSRRSSAATRTGASSSSIRRCARGRAEALLAWAWRGGLPAWEEVDAVVVARGGARWRFASVALDLAAGWDALDALPADGVTASALLDLASSAWLARLAAWLAARRLPLYAALTVDGRRRWAPPADEDGAVAAAFRRHQGRDKGLGPAAGGHAQDDIAAQLAGHGFAVATAASDWRLGPARASFSPRSSPARPRRRGRRSRRQRRRSRPGRRGGRARRPAGPWLSPSAIAICWPCRRKSETREAPLPEERIMARALWNGTTVAESERFEIVEGNVYFPPGAVDRRFFKDSADHHRVPAGRAPLITTRSRSTARKTRMRPGTTPSPRPPPPTSRTISPSGAALRSSAEAAGRRQAGAAYKKRKAGEPHERRAEDLDRRRRCGAAPLARRAASAPRGVRHQRGRHRRPRRWTLAKASIATRSCSMSGCPTWMGASCAG